MSFVEKLKSASRDNNSLLCVGLDVVPDSMPVEFPRTPAGVVEFNRAIVDATADLVCAFKPNLAFYEALGPAGLDALLETRELIPPTIPVIADAKRGDVGHTAGAYARAIFDVYGFDAVTVSPYLGRDALEPFLERADRGVFVLCRTSNPGARDLQDLLVEGEPLYRAVARLVVQWNQRGNAGLVVGATYPREIAEVRRIAPALPLLIPGVGAQAGDLSAAVRAGVDARGELAVVNSSRQVLYASSGRDFAAAAREVATAIRDEINGARDGVADEQRRSRLGE